MVETSRYIADSRKTSYAALKNGQAKCVFFFVETCLVSICSQRSEKGDGVHDGSVQFRSKVLQAVSVIILVRQWYA